MKAFAGVLLYCGLIGFLGAAESGESVLVIYNSVVPTSREIAEHYAERRQVPTNQVLGLALPENEVVTRTEYRERLLKPTLGYVEKNQLITFAPGSGPSDCKTTNAWKVTGAKIRYIVLCRGVPFKILGDPSWTEPGMDNVPKQLRRNDAAVDSEMTVLHWRDLPLTGPLLNYTYGATNGAAITPLGNILMVARLDGPSVAAARALVDKAIQAETNGLWGRAYFDSRGFRTNDLAVGDEALRNAARVSRTFGFETYLDEDPASFPPAFPLSQVALYAGWYENHVSGPFAQPNVEFMPGAFAHHLHSYSASTIQHTNAYWVGPLVEAGVTATLGYVEEPFLGLTADMGIFFSRFLMGGFSFGEAAYAAQPGISWQTTVVGDPLYRPFAKPAQQLHSELVQRKSPLVEWSHLRVVDLNIARGTPVAELIAYLENQDVTPKSAVLTEKLADLYQGVGKTESAIHANENALKLNPTPQQKVRLTFALADRLTAASREDKAFGILDAFYKENTWYADCLGLAQKLEVMADRLKKSKDARRYAKEIKRLTPPPAQKSK